MKLNIRPSVYILAFACILILAAILVFFREQKLSTAPSTQDEFTGTTTLDTTGDATVPIPTEIAARYSSFTYQVLGLDTSMPNLYVKSRLHNGDFRVGGGTPGATISWMLIGHRAAQ